MKLLEILKERGMSKLQLAMGAGITPSDLYCALNGRKPLYPAYRRKIAMFLGFEEHELFGKVGEHDDTRDTDDVEN